MLVPSGKPKFFGMDAIRLEKTGFNTGKSMSESVAKTLLWECDVCGSFMLDLHCKLKCATCGFMRDCSDP